MTSLVRTSASWHALDASKFRIFYNIIFPINFRKLKRAVRSFSTYLCYSECASMSSIFQNWKSENSITGVIVNILRNFKISCNVRKKMNLGYSNFWNRFLTFCWWNLFVTRAIIILLANFKISYNVRKKIFV